MKPVLTAYELARALFVHARRFGTDCVWETGLQMGLSAHALLRLADRLAALDRSWRMPAEAKPRLAVELHDEGWPATRIAREVGAKVGSVLEWTSESPGHAETGVANPHG